MAKAIMIQGTMSNAGKSRDCGWTVPDLSSGRIPDSTV